MKVKPENGNVLFLILIAVALFGALAYTVTSSTRSAPIRIESEKQKLDQAVLNNCESAITLALLRLRNLGHCEDDEINYELPDGSNANPNAPADGHCNIFHPQYGGTSPCGLTEDPTCDLSVLSIGDSCSGIVYAGESGGNRIYTTRADHSSGVYWNNGTFDWIDTGTTSASDGLANTDTLVGLADIGSPYQAAQLCRSYGEKWYLPAQDELNLLYTNKSTIGGFDVSGTYPQGYYWSSTEGNSGASIRQIFNNGQQLQQRKDILFSVRCVRQD